MFPRYFELRVILYLFFLFAVAGCQSKSDGVLAITLHDEVISRTDGKVNAEHDVVAIIRNVGGSSVEIAEVSTSCRCTSIGLLEMTTLAPGQETRLQLSATPPEFGTQRVTISVGYDSAGRRSVEAELVLNGRRLEAPFVQLVTPADLHLSFKSIDEVVNDQVEVTTNEYGIVDHGSQQCSAIRLQSKLSRRPN